jgi:hypothetical protein
VVNLHSGYHLTTAAARRLTEKYGDDQQCELQVAMNDGDALRAVSAAVQIELGGKEYSSATPADRDDCLAALCLANSARRQVDHDELVALEGARAKGASWQAIGVALGHPPDTAAQAAEERHADLLSRFPAYRSIMVRTLP